MKSCLSSLKSPLVAGIACRKLGTSEKSDWALLSWAQRAKMEARTCEAECLDKEKLQAKLPDIRSMTICPPDDYLPQLQGCLAECGVVLLYLPHLKGSFLQGATLKAEGKTVIAMTPRGRDADRFWFSLFHELAHVLFDHADQASGTSPEDEARADRFAQEFLIPQEALRSFKEKGDFCEKAIESFAEKIGIHPGIVVGRLQREKVIGPEMMNHLKAKCGIDGCKATV